jgi:hypothetical protein
MEIDKIPHLKLQPHFFHLHHDYGYCCGGHGSGYVRGFDDAVDVEDDHPYPSVQIVHRSELGPINLRR